MNAAPRPPHIIVVGNIKGGAGKSTLAMHIGTALAFAHYKTAVLDLDFHQASLSKYMQNRTAFIEQHPSYHLPMPAILKMTPSSHDSMTASHEDDKARLNAILSDARQNYDFIIIDTPGHFDYICAFAHSWADMVLTPLNESFVDLDLLAEMQCEPLRMVKAGLYAQMLFEQRIERAKRTKENKNIKWYVLRNRINHIASTNNQNVIDALIEIEKRLFFKQIKGFSERVIFKELFLKGLTLLDIPLVSKNHALTLSHIAARQELRDIFTGLGLPVRL